MDDFIDKVAKAEGGRGSVFLGDVGSPGGLVLAVWNDDADRPTYRSTVPATPPSRWEAEKKLTDAGLTVVRSEREWRRNCRRWRELT